MANEEHLARLTKDVLAWNRWREKNPGIQPDLTGAFLTVADPTEANLIEAELRGADLRGANLTGARIGWTEFGDVDLRTPQGLETLRHDGPSTIGIDTLNRSHGDIEYFIPDFSNGKHYDAY